MWALRAGFDPDGVQCPGKATQRHLRKVLRGIKESVADELLAVIERVDDRGSVRVSSRTFRRQRKRISDFVGEPAYA